jgi:hypothetical protein
MYRRDFGESCRVFRELASRVNATPSAFTVSIFTYFNCRYVRVKIVITLLYQYQLEIFCPLSEKANSLNLE